MFTSGQWGFAIFFIVAFAVGLIYSYRKDLKLHKIHYKNTASVVGITVILAIVIFSAIVFTMHE